MLAELADLGVPPGWPAGPAAVGKGASFIGCGDGFTAAFTPLCGVGAGDGATLPATVAGAAGKAEGRVAEAGGAEAGTPGAGFSSLVDAAAPAAAPTAGCGAALVKSAVPTP